MALESRQQLQRLRVDAEREGPARQPRVRVAQLQVADAGMIAVTAKVAASRSDACLRMVISLSILNSARLAESRPISSLANVKTRGRADFFAFSRLSRQITMTRVPTFTRS